MATRRFSIKIARLLSAVNLHIVPLSANSFQSFRPPAYPALCDVAMLERWRQGLLCIVALLIIGASAHATYGSMQVEVTMGGDAITASQSAASESVMSERATDANLQIVADSTGDVIAVGRTIVVRGAIAKGVIVLGGDCIVEGRVEGDVGTIGGSVIQRAGSYIGGDVIALGGTYHHGRTAPGRNPASTTIMVAGYEDALRDAFREPSSVFAPRLTVVYLIQRLFAAGFWFVAGLGLTWIAPGAISRAAARLQLTSLRVAVIGFLSAVVMICGVSVTLRFLPAWLSTLVALMAFCLMAGAYLFGRIVVQAATGRLLQRLVLRRFTAPRARDSELVALLAGALFWVGALSVPYIWALLIFALLIVSLGLTLTARHQVKWWRES